ncbi:MAG: hypothetical protein JXR87_07355, partial [Candidatus Marinimicrobia bacterium]|nr:hypothetical protein [Candidatus Neomarinimicrobiota bacterium]
MRKRLSQFSLTIILALIGSVSAQNQSLVLMDFEAIGIPPEEAKVFTEHLQVELFNRELYTILEMPDIQNKLAEHNYSLVKCSSAPCLTEAGKLSGTDLIIGGSITKIEGNFSVTVRMIDVKSGNVVKIFVYRHSGDIISLFSDGVVTVADKLSQPMIEPEKKPVTAQTYKTTMDNSMGYHTSSKKITNPGGIGPALASCLIGPRV